MKDLTDEQKNQLLGKIKSFLSITWDDEETDDKILDFIIGSINRIDDICGTELDYLNDATDESGETVAYPDNYLKMCYVGRELLKNRVFYLNEKALDDFESNYRSELTALYIQGRIYKDAQQQ